MGPMTDTDKFRTWDSIGHRARRKPVLLFWERNIPKRKALETFCYSHWSVFHSNLMRISKLSSYSRWEQTETQKWTLCIEWEIFDQSVLNGISSSNPSSYVSGSYVEGGAECKSQMAWLILKKHCLSETKILKHMWTYRDCGSMCMFFRDSSCWCLNDKNISVHL